jgi:hypothetical protein
MGLGYRKVHHEESMYSTKISHSEDYKEMQNGEGKEKHRTL